ncbi:MAG: hypothetical protein Kow0067_07730 [Coriobacteriia bacterium]
MPEPPHTPNSALGTVAFLGMVLLTIDAQRAAVENPPNKGYPITRLTPVTPVV